MAASSSTNSIHSVHTNTNQDPSSVYYIHPSDASTTQLVSVKFNGIGFHNWKRSMMLTLSAKNKLGFVNGTIPVPVSTSNEYKYWERCNDLVISWILFNLDEHIAKSVLFLQTAKEIWEDLEERFGYASMEQIYSLEQQLLEINQGSDSISEFFTKIKTLWDGLNDADPLPHCTCNNCTCNLTQKIQQKQQEHRLLQFMMKLNEQFSTVRGNILMMHPVPNVSQAYRLFAQEERHKEMSQLSTQTESLAFAANRNNSYQAQRTFSGSKQQSAGYNSNYKAGSSTGSSTAVGTNFGRKGGKPNYFCTRCKISGHSIERCLKIHGFPPGFIRPDKRMAVVSQFNAEDSSSDNCKVAHTDPNHTITVDQYNHLMTILGQSSSDSQTTESSKHALLAGPFSEQASDSSW